MIQREVGKAKALKNDLLMRFLKVLIFSFSIVSMLACSSQKQLPPSPPNIVIVMADDLGIGDVGVYGQNVIATPNIDQLASEGIQFNNFYSGSTVCAPSRASFFTGQHTGHTEIRGNGEFPLSPDKKIIPELLKEQGYTNAIYGKWGLGLEGTSGAPELRSWDEFLGHLHHIDGHFQQPDSLDAIHDGQLTRVALEDSAYASDVFTEAAVDFISRQSQDQPFFLFVSYTIPHAELRVPQRFLEKQLDEEGSSFHAPEQAWPVGRHYGAQKYPKAAYAGMVESVDAYVGNIKAALERTGLRDNTIFIFTSDNGTHVEGGRTIKDVEYFGSSGPHRGVKRDLYEGGIKVPFIVSWPEIVSPGKQSSHLGAFWDLYPTFAEVSGASVQGEIIDGISLSPLLLGKDQPEHDYLYWEFHEDGGKQALIQGEWKVVRLNVNEDPSGPVELYNLERDPGEIKNLAREHPERKKELTQIMDEVRTPNQHFNFAGKK